MVIEYAIRIKDENNTLTVNDICYDPILLSFDNQFIKDKIDEALVKFKYDPRQADAPEITLRFKMVYQS